MSKSWTFAVQAFATVQAESEDKARNLIRDACAARDEDVYYNGVGVYIPGHGAEYELIDEWEGTK